MKLARSEAAAAADADNRARRRALVVVFGQLGFWFDGAQLLVRLLCAQNV